ncbi:MAG: MASE1 domain-containing protein [Oscillatoria sp. PMC 1068.18]|nr:MASE1 domain-containing protein [Oscillatoria sp. PMC 1076.18]MEC4989515.1 MASE1 domain-containing protein [Oscillatoria sp. PMC 1068.18]
MLKKYESSKVGICDHSTNHGAMAFRSVDFKQYLAIVITVAIAYILSGYFALKLLGLSAVASPVWLPAGIALAALLIWGKQVLPAIFLGDLLLLQSFGASGASILASTIGSTASAWLGFLLLRKSRFSPTLARIQDVIKLIIFAAFLSPVVKASLDILIQFLAGEIPSHNFWQNWWIFWLGDSTGILVITPVFLVWQQQLSKAQNAQSISRNFRQLYRRHSKAIFEFIVCFSLLVIVSWIVFISQTTIALSEYPLEYLPFPLVVWAALRFCTPGAVFSSLIVSGLAIWGALLKQGPFIVNVSSINQAILLLQTFTIAVTITALILAATMTERQRVEAKLRATLERDRLLSEVSQRIRQSLDLEAILDTTVAEIRHLIQADRVCIAYACGDKNGTFVAESVAPFYPSMQGINPDDRLSQAAQAMYGNGQVRVIDDTRLMAVNPTIKEFYQKYQIKAAIAVPLMLENQLYGLLVAHQCEGVRYWQTDEVDLLKQLATQVVIAMQQAQLYQQVQNLNTNLERQVTERTQQLHRQIKEVQKLSQLKDIFLQAVSHDLRTSIMGMALILKQMQQQTGDKVTMSRRILEKTILSCDRQLTLINALSEDLESDGREMALHPQQLFFPDLVTETISEMQSLFEQNSASWEKFFPDNLPPIVADAAKLKCVLTNLITNALKHNPPGVKITCKATVENQFLRCTISDNGVGMNKSQQQSLFKLYVRSLHNRHLTGIGLGSYLCRQIITAHGGEIGVDSIPDVGTSFWLIIPLAS